MEDRTVLAHDGWKTKKLLCGILEEENVVVYNDIENCLGFCNTLYLTFYMVKKMIFKIYGWTIYYHLSFLSI